MSCAAYEYDIMCVCDASCAAAAQAMRWRQRCELLSALSFGTPPPSALRVVQAHARRHIAAKRVRSDRLRITRRASSLLVTEMVRREASARTIQCAFRNYAARWTRRRAVAELMLLRSMVRVQKGLIRAQCDFASTKPRHHRGRGGGRRGGRLAAVDAFDGVR
jgi:hypothetical protein